MDHFFINQPNNNIPENETTNLLKENNAIDYHRSLANYQATPVHYLPLLAKKLGVKGIFIKDESYRLGLKAFKGLGASYAIHKTLLTKKNIETFCTATDGNHGRAVAWAARRAKKKAIIYVPKGTTKNRILAIQNEGAEVYVLEKNYEETCTYAAEQSLKNGWELIQDTAWEGYEKIPALIKAGYLTQFIEMEKELHLLPKPKIDVVFLQAGVGSWAASAIWYYLNRYGEQRPKIIIVESIEAAGLLTSFKAKKRVQPNGTFETIMAGLNCGIPSSTAWEIIKNGTDAIIAISDAYAKKGMRMLYEQEVSITAGASGVGGFAGFLALQNELGLKDVLDYLNIGLDTNILFYNTEGITDQESFYKIITV